MTELLKREGCTARTLWRHDRTLYVGWAGPVGEPGAGVSVVDLDTGRERTFQPTSRLVSAIAVCGGHVFASLVSGDLVEWEELGCGIAPRIWGQCDASVLTVKANELYWGTRAGELCRYTGMGSIDHIASVRKDLYGVATTAGWIFGAYDDGKVRGWSLAEPKKKADQILTVGRTPACSVGDDGRLWTVTYTGDVARHALDLSDAQRCKLPGGYARMVHVSAGARGRAAIIADGQPIRVLSPELEVLSEVAVEGRIEDVWLDDSCMYVAGAAVSVWPVPQA